MAQGTEALWTINQLGAQVAAALAQGYSGPRNTRIRAIPNSRTVRYYTTLGLIDRPAAMDGRTALYGPRHLQQLVALKQLQARGLSLMEVQQKLAGATNVELGRMAGVEALPPPVADSAGAGAARQAFWHAAPAEEEDEAEAAAPGELAEQAAAASPRALEMTLLFRIAVAPGVTLLLDRARRPSADDLEALQRAAAPLAKEIRSRGLYRTHTTHDKE